MKKISKAVFQQLTKIGMIWAIILGPVWAKNLTLFTLWACNVGMAILLVFGAAVMSDVEGKARKDKDYAKQIVDSKTPWYFNILSFALLGTMAAYGWFWTGGFYALLWFFLWSIGASNIDKCKKVLDES